MNTFKLDRGGWRSTCVLPLSVVATLSLAGCVSIPVIDPGGGGCGGATPHASPVPPAEQTGSEASARTDDSSARGQHPAAKRRPSFGVWIDEQGRLHVEAEGTVTLPDKDRTEVGVKASIPVPWPKPRQQATPQPLVERASAAPAK